MVDGIRAGCGMLACVLSAGQVADCPMMIPVLEAILLAHHGPGRPRLRPRRVLTDKAYSSRANRAWLCSHRIRTHGPGPGRPRPSTVGPGAHAVGAHRSSTPLSTRTVMPWNAASAV